MKITIREDVNLIFDVLDQYDEATIDKEATRKKYIEVMTESLEKVDGYDEVEIIDIPGVPRTNISFSPGFDTPEQHDDEAWEIEQMMMDRFAWSDFWVENEEEEVTTCS